MHLYADTLVTLYASHTSGAASNSLCHRRFIYLFKKQFFFFYIHENRHCIVVCLHNICLCVLIITIITMVDDDVGRRRRIVRLFPARIGSRALVLRHWPDIHFPFEFAHLLEPILLTRLVSSTTLCAHSTDTFKTITLNMVTLNCPNCKVKALLPKLIYRWFFYIKKRAKILQKSFFQTYLK